MPKPSLLLRSLGLAIAFTAAPLALLADGLSDILTRKTVRIAVCDFAPWTFTNRAGQLEGFEIDNGTLIARDLGVTPEFKLLTLDAAYEALDHGDVDFIAAGLAITPERALRMEFTTPYFESGATIVTNRRLVSSADTAADLNQPNYVIAVVDDTFSAGFASQTFDVAMVKTYPDAAAAEDDLVAGRAHAFITSLPDARILVATHSRQLATPLSAPLARSVAGFSVKRGNQALLNFLNAWIAARIADGHVKQYHDHWFSGYEWLPRMKNRTP